jgi:hypothetical protein
MHTRFPLVFRTPALIAALSASGLIAAAEAAPPPTQLYEVKPLRGSVRPTRRAPRTQGATPQPAGEAAPRAPDPNAAIDTELTVELFVGREGVGLQAQPWQKVFEEANVALQIRPRSAADSPAVDEQLYGKLRMVHVKGRIERNGRLVFPGRSFSAGDGPALAEWLAELKTYGARGNPRGQPMWGLGKDVFDELFRALARPVEAETAGRAFDEALAGLNLPTRYPLRFTAAAQLLLDRDGRRKQVNRLSLKGIAQGTALAMLLSQYGLGFHPTRTPSGSVELACAPAAEGDLPWPIGWEGSQPLNPTAVAPKLYEQTTVELKDQKLLDVLEAISQQTATPIRLDFAQIAERGIDLDPILVSVPSRRMTWSLLLTKITNPSFLTPHIRCDEARRPLVWITVIPLNPVPSKAPALPGRTPSSAAAKTDDQDPPRVRPRSQRPVRRPLTDSTLP